MSRCFRRSVKFDGPLHPQFSVTTGLLRLAHSPKLLYSTMYVFSKPEDSAILKSDYLSRFEFSEKGLDRSRIHLRRLHLFQRKPAQLVVGQAVGSRPFQTIRDLGHLQGLAQHRGVRPACRSIFSVLGRSDTERYQASWKLKLSCIYICDAISFQRT